MVGARCISAPDARRSVDLPVLIAIAASFGVGKALEQSGVAKMFALLLVEATRSWGPTATLAAIYFGTMVLNELISNNAAAALSFPFCLESARLLGVNAAPVYHGRDAGRLLCVCLPDRLSNPYDGIRPWRLSLHRLHARWHSVKPLDVARRG